MGRVTIDLHPANDRFVTAESGRTTYHSFSYGRHYDPGNVAFGPLVALNDEQLPASTGYAEHRHAATEIVTWVLEGRLHHKDSLGNDSVLGTGSVAVASTGSGITHSERAPEGSSARFLQMMLRPDEVDREPTWEGTRLDESAGLQEVVGPAGIDVGVTGARLFLGSVADDVPLPEARFHHLFVVSGGVRFGDRRLGPSDSARIVDEKRRKLRVDDTALVALWAFR